MKTDYIFQHRVFSSKKSLLAKTLHEWKIIFTRKPSNTISNKKEIFICLEVWSKISLHSKKKLTEIFTTRRKNMKLNVVFRSSNKICNVFRFKDQISNYINSNVIYKYKCNICNDVYTNR